MTGTDVAVIDLESEIATLAKRHQAARGLGIQVLGLAGTQAENLLERLPDSAKEQLESATTRALELSMRAAAQSRDVVPDQQGWLNTAVATAMGAAGGVGGLPTALAELPVTTTVLLRAIQGIATEYGFDTSDPEVQKECLAVFASAGPLSDDDDTELGFLAARVTLTGATLHGMIARVAPRLAAALGQKLAAQAVPLIGAAAGAAMNYTFTSYYQNMAHVHFGLLRLSKRSGRDRGDLTKALQGVLKSAK